MKKGDHTSHVKELTFFFLVTFGFTWLFWIASLFPQYITLPFPAALLLRCGTYMPSAAGLLLAYRFGGKAELRTLFVSHINFHIKLRWLLFIVLVPAGVSTLSCLIFELFGGSLPKFQIEPPFIPAAFVYVLIFLGPLGEEAGWRGFALKRLLTELSPIKAALLLGAVWSVWHLPLFFIDGTTQNKLTDFGLPAALACYLVYTVMISILITLVYVMTDENTLTALLFHAAANLSLGVVPLIFIKSGAVILLLVLGGTTAGFTYAYKKILFCEDLHGHSDN